MPDLTRAVAGSRIPWTRPPDRGTTMRSRPGTPWRSTTPARRRAGWAASLAWSLVLCRAAASRTWSTSRSTSRTRRATFFADGQSSRPLVAGTVARGQLRVDPAYYTGQVGRPLIDDDPDRRSTGRCSSAASERFNIYCSPCHGRLGRRPGDDRPARASRRRRRSTSEYLRDAPVGPLLQRDHQRLRRDVLVRRRGSRSTTAGRSSPTSGRCS